MKTVKKSIFRVYCENKLVGCIAAEDEKQASAYALGKYGASSHVDQVDLNLSDGITVIIESKPCNSSERGRLMK